VNGRSESVEKETEKVRDKDKESEREREREAERKMVGNRVRKRDFRNVRDQ
jgi:hypothetical protein